MEHTMIYIQNLKYIWFFAFYLSVPKKKKGFKLCHITQDVNIE